MYTSEDPGYTLVPHILNMVVFVGLHYHLCYGPGLVLTNNPERFFINTFLHN